MSTLPDAHDYTVNCARKIEFSRLHGALIGVLIDQNSEETRSGARTATD
jgi:hypothetical protein